MFQNQQARICLLYLPLFELLYQNLKQLSAQQHTCSPVLGLNVSLLRPLGTDTQEVYSLKYASRTFYTTKYQVTHLHPTPLHPGIKG